MDELVYYAALSFNESIGPHRFAKIKEIFKSLKSFFELSIDDQMDFLHLRNENLRKTFEKMLSEGEKIVETCQKKNIQMITIDDYAYHPKLKEVPEAPFLYYQIGHMNYSIKLVGIVGTRQVSPEAVSINEYFTRELVNYNLGIVSGMAKGHDSVALKITIQEEGFPVAVLGSGIDVIYPPEHKLLYREIAERGAVISEYPPGAFPLKQHFPYRNRIISGLSEVLLVVQAPEKSGALFTANFAAEQGRDVYAVPGNPADSKNKGSNELIQKGAKIALNPEEIALEILGKKAKKIKRIKIEKKENVGKEEKAILRALDSEKDFEELMELTGIPLPRLSHILTLMEIQGLIIQYPGRVYIRNSA